MLELEDSPKCKHCGEHTGRPGPFCNIEHWRLWLAARIPDSWRQMHSWMIGYQQATGKQPLIAEIVGGTAGISTRGGVVLALRRLQQKGFVKTTLPEGHKRRYRAVGNLPMRKS